MQEFLTIHPPPIRSVQVSKSWYNNDPVMSHFFDGFATLFPQGELYFVWSVRNFAAAAKTETMQKQIEDFSVQEKNHAALHKSYNRSLAKAGYDMVWMESSLANKIAFVKENFSPLVALAITVATEHVTAILGERVIHGIFVPAGSDPEMRKLWIWHALEEVDHKSVAMDVFKAAGGGYRHLAFGMLFTIFSLWGDIFLRMFHMLKKDGLLAKPRTWLQLGAMMFGKHGLVRQTGWETLKFFGPGFHPAQHDNYGLVEQGRVMLARIKRQADGLTV